mgnify:CR=1 FL=1
MATEFQRGDAVVFVRTQTTHTVGAPNVQRGGVSVVARTTGVSRRAITEGIKELRERKMAGKISPA